VKFDIKAEVAVLETGASKNQGFSINNDEGCDRFP
jgi:hypothetical protein